MNRNCIFIMYDDIEEEKEEEKWTWQVKEVHRAMDAAGMQRSSF